jgi:hypothetical protein
MANEDDDDKVKKGDADENFGLPDLEFKPLQDKPAEASTPLSSGSGGTPSAYESYVAEESKSKAPVVLTLVIILVVAIAGYLIYSYVYVPRQEAKAKQEALAAAEAKRKKAEEERIAAERAAEAERKRLEDLANAQPKIGTIEVLNARTKRYYVVIVSDIDDDLLMDYAKKLSSTGINLKVIPPFGGKQFSRLAIADHDTFALAQQNADAAKATYGTGVWVLKY